MIVIDHFSVISPTKLSYFSCFSWLVDMLFKFTITISHVANQLFFHLWKRTRPKIYDIIRFFRNSLSCFQMVSSAIWVKEKLILVLPNTASSSFDGALPMSTVPLLVTKCFNGNRCIHHNEENKLKKKKKKKTQVANRIWDT